MFFMPAGRQPEKTQQARERQRAEEQRGDGDERPAIAIARGAIDGGQVFRHGRGFRNVRTSAVTSTAIESAHHCTA
jgi:hypothetical protein